MAVFFMSEDVNMVSDSEKAGRYENGTYPVSTTTDFFADFRFTGSINRYLEVFGYAESESDIHFAICGMFLALLPWCCQLLPRLQKLSALLQFIWAINFYLGNQLLSGQSTFIWAINFYLGNQIFIWAIKIKFLNIGLAKPFLCTP